MRHSGSSARYESALLAAKRTFDRQERRRDRAGDAGRAPGRGRTPDDVDRVLPGFFYHVLALRYRESAPHLRRRRSHHRDSRCWFRGSIRQPFSCIHSASCVSEYRCAPSRASRRPGITAPFNARRRGHHRGNVYRIELGSAIVTLATEPGGLTRFRF